MTTATLDHEEIKAEQIAEIYRALANKGTAYEQSPAGDRIGPHLSAAGALADDIGKDGGEVDEVVTHLFAAVAAGKGAIAVSMHARSLVSLLVRKAADLNATAIENGDAPQTRFREF